MDDDSEIEVWSNALADITKAVNGGAALDQVLSLIARRATMLVDFTCCSVFTRTEDRNSIFIHGSYGLTQQFVENYRMHPMSLETGAGGRGAPSVRAVLTGEPAAILDLESEVGVDADEWRAWGAIQGFRSILAVPIIAENDQVLGSLTVYSRVSRSFSDLEFRSLALLAQHAHLAIVATRNRDRLEAEIQSLKDDRLVSDERYQRVAAAARLHGRLMRLVVDGGAGIQGIIDAVSAEVGGPATVWDTSGVPLLTSERPAPQESTEMSDHGRHQALRTCASRTPHEVIETTGAPSYWAPIELYDHVVGALEVSPNPALGNLYDEETIVQCALTIAFFMSEEAQQAEAAVKLTHELVGVLLSPTSGAGDVSIAARATALGHDLSIPHTPIMVVSTQASGLPQRGMESLIRRLASSIGGSNPRPIIGQMSGRALVLLPEREGSEPSRELKRLSGALEAAYPKAQFKLLVGPSTTTLASIRSSCLTLENAASLLHSGSPAIVDLSDLGVIGLLLETGSGVMLSRFADRILAGVPDGEKGQKLIGTLSAWLESGMSTQETSARLHLHQNTVTYRLRRTEELLGVNLRRPDHVLSLQLAILVRGIPEGLREHGLT